MTRTEWAVGNDGATRVSYNIDDSEIRISQGSDYMMIEPADGESLIHALIEAFEATGCGMPDLTAVGYTFGDT